MGITEREITQAMTAMDMMITVLTQDKQVSCHIGKKISKQSLSFKEKNLQPPGKKELTAQSCCQLSGICLAVFYRMLKITKNINVMKQLPSRKQVRSPMVVQFW